MVKTIIVRLKKEKNTFEIIVNHGTVQKWRDGNLGWSKVPATDMIFKNSSKGDRYTSKELKSAFGTDNIDECMQNIARRGIIQLTAQDRKDKITQKRKQIVQFIHKYYTDPKTSRPHPVQRIDNAITQVKYNVDMDIPVEKQVQVVVKKLPGVLTIRKSVVEGALIIPNQHMGKVSGIINKWATIRSQSYLADGCHTNVEMIPGDYDALINELSSATKNDFIFNISGSSSGSSGSSSISNKSFNKSEKENKRKKKKGKR